MEPRISTPFGKAQDVDQFTELPVTFYTSGFVKVIARLVEKFSHRKGSGFFALMFGMKYVATERAHNFAMLLLFKMCFFIKHMATKRNHYHPSSQET